MASRPRRSQPTRPSIAELREVTQPAAIRGRGVAEHWTGDLYMRRLSPYVTRHLVRTGISANGVTWLMIVSGWLAAFGLLVPGILGAALAVVLTQLQMMWDACDGEVARWRATSSPVGIFLDKFGHYTVETLLVLALGVRAAGGVDEIRPHLPWVLAGALAAWLFGLNKALADMVVAARAQAGVNQVPDSPQTRAPRGGALARLHRAARLVPIHRISHSIEVSLLVLVAAVADAVRGDLLVTRALTTALVVAAAVSVAGQFVAILASDRMRAR